MRESKVEQSVVVWATARGIYTRKFASPAHRGVPDRFFARQGRCCFIEFKAPGKRPTALQLRELEMMKEQGIPAEWFNNFDDATQFLNSALWT